MCVHKNTCLFVCLFVCVLSKNLLKSVFFCQPWFGSYLVWSRLETVRFFCMQPQPKQMLTWQKNTLLNTLLERAHKQMCYFIHVFSYMLFRAHSLCYTFRHVFWKQYFIVLLTMYCHLIFHERSTWQQPSTALPLHSGQANTGPSNVA